MGPHDIIARPYDLDRKSQQFPMGQGVCCLVPITWITLCVSGTRRKQRFLSTKERVELGGRTFEMCLKFRRHTAARSSLARCGAIYGARSTFSRSFGRCSSWTIATHSVVTPGKCHNGFSWASFERHANATRIGKFGYVSIYGVRQRRRTDTPYQYLLL